MTDHQHTPTGPDRGPGPGADRAAGAGAGGREERRAPGKPGARGTSGQRGTADGARRTGEADRAGTTEAPGTPADAAPGGAGARTDAGARTGPDAGGRAGPEAAAQPAPEEAGPALRFRRDRRHRMIAGVCAGLGRQCDMDPVIFRITLAVLAATGGIGLIFYGFAWLFVTYDDEDENEVRKLLTGRVDGQALAGVLFALVGCGVFLSMLGNAGVLTFGAVLSLLLAGAGYWSQHRGAPDPDPLAAQAVADAPPEAQAPPAPAAYPSWWRDPIVKDGTHDGGTGYLWGPADSRDRDLAAAVTIGRGAYRTGREGPRASAPGPPRRRGARWTGGWTFLLALVAGALGTGGTWHDHTLGTSLQTGLSCALVVFGVGIALSAFLGRTGAGSVLLAIVTAGLLAGSTALPEDITTHWTDTTWRPAATTSVKPAYSLGTGDGTLDLTRITVAGNRTVATRARVGLGRLRVILPPGVTVKATIDVGVGDIQLPGDRAKDVDVAPGKYRQVTLPPAPGAGAGGTIELDLRVGAGQAEVSRAAS
ncbi:PspC domain-containing protein [Streptomyces sp. NPDC046831]|uniref:PspC domain-containing protein n=1 Tax=Streptomyces sp. NPDC046831 TaxID=3154805 RepID=UPI0033FA16FA